METNKAKLFMNGQSQVVRLPKEFRFSGKEVYIKKINDIVCLIPKKKLWKNFFDSLSQFSTDFMNERADSSPLSISRTPSPRKNDFEVLRPQARKKIVKII